jgi:serine/threonine protein phosphatase PrpC
VLCSDGLTDSLTDEAIQQIAASERDICRVCKALVAAAKSRDNITILIAEFRGQ